MASSEEKEDGQHPDEPTGRDTSHQSEPARGVELFGRGVRTALRNNSTAYGFSISITVAYGLVSTTQQPVNALETVSFAIGAAVAFLLVGAVSIRRFTVGSLSEDGQVATISGGIDVLSVAAAVAMAFGLSRIPGFAAWPLTGLGTTGAYLLVAGLDVLLARSAARRTSFGRSQ